MTLETLFQLTGTIYFIIGTLIFTILLVTLSVGLFRFQQLKKRIAGSPLVQGVSKLNAFAAQPNFRALLPLGSLVLSGVKFVQKWYKEKK
jgi:hypothetical protein